MTATVSWSERVAGLVGRFRFSLRTLLALVLAVGAVTAAYRTLSDLDPVRAASRQSTDGTFADRHRAVMTLAAADGNDAFVAIPALIRTLDDPDPRIRRLSAFGLGRVLDFAGREVLKFAPDKTGPRFAALARDVTDALTTAASDADSEVRFKAVGGLVTVYGDRSLVPLTKPLGTAPAAINLRPCVAALTAALEDPDERVRERAASAFAVLPDYLPIAPPEALLRGLDDPSQAVRSSAFLALCSIEQGLDAHVGRLFRAVSRRPEDLYYQCFWLRRVRVGPSALPEVVPFLSDPDWPIRSCAASLIEAIGPDAVGAVPALMASLKDSVDDPKLPKFPDGSGQDGFDTIEELDPVVSAVRALIALDPPKAVFLADTLSALTRALQSPRVDRRHAAVRAIGLLKSDGEAAVPELIAVVAKEKDETLRRAVLSALSAVAAGTASAPKAIDAIEQALTDGLDLDPIHEVRPLLEPLQKGLAGKPAKDEGP